VILEVNAWQPEKLEGIHDVYSRPHGPELMPGRDRGRPAAR
jgi:acyl-CoA hydrolase